MADAESSVRVTAARMALVSSKPMNVNGAYMQTQPYLVLLTGPAGKDGSKGATDAVGVGA